MSPFDFLNQYSTDKRSKLYGLLPSISTLLTLFAVSAVVAYAPMLWASAALKFSTYVSYFTYSLLSVSFVALSNFWFDREIQFYTNGCSPINYGDEFGELHLDQLVNHVVQELNARDGTQDPSHPNHLTMPRLAKFAGADPKLICVPGRSIHNSALYFSDGMLNKHLNRLTQPHLAALIQAELHKIKRRRSIPDLLLSIATSFGQTLDSLMASPNVLLKTVGYLLVPLKLCMMVHYAVSRSHVYEAAEAVVECGRGKDYLLALNRKGHAARTKKRGDSDYFLNEAMAARLDIKRPPYLQPCTDWAQQTRFMPVFIGRLIDGLLKPVADWVDSNEMMTDDKAHTYRFFSLIDICVRNWSFYLKEAMSSKPSSLRLKMHIKDCMNNPALDKRPFVIPEGDRYKPVDHFKGIRWRFKQATMVHGAMSYGKLKRDGCQDDLLCVAEDVRKICRHRLQSFLAKKGLVLSKQDLRDLLKPLMFSHDADTLKVEIEHHETLNLLKARLRQERKSYTNKELEELFETQACKTPEFRDNPRAARAA